MSKKLDKALATVLDVNPIVDEPAVIPTKIMTKLSSDMDLQEDLTDAYQQSRDNLQDLIEHGKDAMEEMLRIAKESEHPRAFEVFGTLLKNTLEANKELLSMQKQMRDMDSKRESNTNHIDKAIFVGSTKELQSLLKNEEF